MDQSAEDFEWGAGLGHGAIERGTDRIMRLIADGAYCREEYSSVCPSGRRAGDQDHLVLEPGATVDHDLRTLFRANNSAGTYRSGRKTGNARDGTGK
jgi:hypothetical protein